MIHLLWSYIRNVLGLTTSIFSGANMVIFYKISLLLSPISIFLKFALQAVDVFCNFCSGRDTMTLALIRAPGIWWIVFEYPHIGWFYDKVILHKYHFVLGKWLYEYFNFLLKSTYWEESSYSEASFNPPQVIIQDVLIKYMAYMFQLLIYVLC